jgi:hypothetical protein
MEGWKLGRRQPDVLLLLLLLLVRGLWVDRSSWGRRAGCADHYHQLLVQLLLLLLLLLEHTGSIRRTV